MKGWKKKMKKEAQYLVVVPPPFFHKECRPGTILGLVPSIKAQNSLNIKILLKLYFNSQYTTTTSCLKTLDGRINLIGLVIL